MKFLGKFVPATARERIVLLKISKFATAVLAPKFFLIKWNIFETNRNPAVWELSKGRELFCRHHYFVGIKEIKLWHFCEITSLTQWKTESSGCEHGHFSISKKSMFSLKDLDSRREMFSTGRIFLPWSTAIRGLTRKLLIGGDSKGPAMNPFRDQLAIVSEISMPYL